ncbi:glycoside hydrolase family 28 protein [Mariniflexile sp. HNIBRBA6329]|uniref:glycoside hydrolase family 28 protein n=1 Tax=Mariniflexile sp. HNIBRBA6329 TaxID=3373088 RepID=UPI0037467D80
MGISFKKTIAIFGSLIAVLCACQEQEKKLELNIPTVSQVGAIIEMPFDIEPIVGAPFSMPEFTRPSFPDVSVNIADKGATESIAITDIVNRAIDEVSEKGGGTVVIPQGKWKSARIQLKSDVNLHISEGAIVEFSGVVSDWLPAVFTRHEGIELLGAGAFIYANGQDNIAVTGKGTILGPELDSEVRKRTNTSADVEKDVPIDMPIEERLFDGMEGREFQPPRTIAPINCTNVFIEGVTMTRSAIWNVVPTYCENVIIRGITVNSLGIPRGDGIDVESSKNVLIEYCTLNCGDDCFTLKSGRGKHGERIGKPTENVVIRYSLAQQGHGAITCGSETAGNIKNIYAYDCVFNGTYTGFRFKAFRPRGGGTENVLYERIRMIDVNDAFVWDMLGSRRWIGELADRLPQRKVNELTPIIRNLHFKDFIVESSNKFINANCIPELPVKNVLIENGEVHCNELIPKLNDVDGFLFRNLSIYSKDNSINILDGKNIGFTNVQFNVPYKKLALNLQGQNSSPISFQSESGQVYVNDNINDLALKNGFVTNEE